MALVTVTGNVHDNGGAVIPASLIPELWFRPKEPTISPGGLLVGVEVKAQLNMISGAFTVTLESTATYVAFLRWVLNPSESVPERRAWGYARWGKEISPGLGGDIGTLPSAGPDALYYFGPLSDPPPPGFRGWWEVQAEPGREDSDDPFIGDVRRVYGG